MPILTGVDVPPPDFELPEHLRSLERVIRENVADLLGPNPTDEQIQSAWHLATEIIDQRLRNIRAVARLASHATFST